MFVPFHSSSSTNLGLGSPIWLVGSWGKITVWRSGRRSWTSTGIALLWVRINKPSLVWIHLSWPTGQQSNFSSSHHCLTRTPWGWGISKWRCRSPCEVPKLWAWSRSLCKARFLGGGRGCWSLEGSPAARKAISLGNPNSPTPFSCSSTPWLADNEDMREARKPGASTPTSFLPWSRGSPKKPRAMPAMPFWGGCAASSFDPFWGVALSLSSCCSLVSFCAGLELSFPNLPDTHNMPAVASNKEPTNLCLVQTKAMPAPSKHCETSKDPSIPEPPSQATLRKLISSANRSCRLSDTSHIPSWSRCRLKACPISTFVKPSGASSKPQHPT